MITINAAFGQEEKVLGTLGRIGENETRQIVFDCSDILAEYPGAEIICVMQRHCDRTAYLADAVLAGNVLTVTLTDADVSASGDLRIELRALADGKIRKSAVYTGQVVSALRGQEDKPGSPAADLLNRLDATLDRAENSVSAADQAAKAAQTIADTVQAKLDNGDFIGSAGEDGKDGEKGPKGDTGETGPQGAPGSDASVTADNIQAALGYTPIKDVQLNGESLVQDSVATIPLAGYNRLGAVQLDPAGFAAASVEGKLALVPPTNVQISTHTHTQRPITPSCMDYAVKAAMCDGKGAAWTAVEQKAARDRMGIPGDYELIEEITLAEESAVSRTTEPNGTQYNFAVIMLRAEFPASEKTSNIRISYGIGNNLSAVISYFLSPYKTDAVKYGYSKVWVENNRYRSGWWTCVTKPGEFAQYYENPVQQDKYSIANGNITAFTANVMAAGTKITIYGVRAQ